MVGGLGVGVGGSNGFGCLYFWPLCLQWNNPDECVMVLATLSLALSFCTLSIPWIIFSCEKMSTTNFVTDMKKYLEIYQHSAVIWIFYSAQAQRDKNWLNKLQFLFENNWHHTDAFETSHPGKQKVGTFLISWTFCTFLLDNSLL